jgi:hypothetical protein
MPQHLPVSSKLVARTLAALGVFGALSAFGGAVLGVVMNGAGVPLEYLAGSPFTSYLVPGLVLGLVVGGTQLAAAIALLRNWRKSLLLAAVAGFGMIIWIFVELAVIKQYSWLQAVYFTLGVLELILVFALLGLTPGFVRPLRQPSQLPANA